MRSILLARCLRALPVYGFAVLLVLGVARALDVSTVHAAPTVVDVEPDPIPALRLTLIVGHAPLPLLVPTPAAR